MNLGERIYEFRNEKNLSQGDLADRLDVSRQSISKWENNMAVPDLDKLIKLCDVFEISLDELTGREKPQEKIPYGIKETISKLSRNQKLGWGLIGIAILSLIIPFGMIFTLPLVLTGVMYIKEIKNVKVYTVWLIYLFLQLGINTFLVYYVAHIVEAICLLLLCFFTCKHFEFKTITISKSKAILILVGGFLYDFLYVVGTWWCFYSGLTEWEFHIMESGETMIVGNFSVRIYAIVNIFLTLGIGFSFVGISYGIKRLKK